jgi:hypothetical protein
MGMPSENISNVHEKGIVFIGGSADQAVERYVHVMMHGEVTLIRQLKPRIIYHHQRE